MDITFQTNYWLGFPESNSDILLNLTHWQYWWWFWFTYLLCLYYFFFLRLLKNRLLKFRPKIVTAYKARGKWGDFLVCLLPVTWCINILSNSNFILRMLEWQTESSLFTIRIRGRQWYWVYKIEVKSLVTMTNLLKNLGHNYWVLFSVQKLNYLQDYSTMVHIKNNKDILQSYGSGEFGFELFKKKMQGTAHKTDYFFFKKKIKNIIDLNKNNNNKNLVDTFSKIKQNVTNKFKFEYVGLNTKILKFKFSGFKYNTRKAILNNAEFLNIINIKNANKSWKFLPKNYFMNKKMHLLYTKENTFLRIKFNAQKYWKGQSLKDAFIAENKFRRYYINVMKEAQAFVRNMKPIIIKYNLLHPKIDKYLGNKKTLTSIDIIMPNNARNLIKNYNNFRKIRINSRFILKPKLKITLNCNKFLKNLDLIQKTTKIVFAVKTRVESKFRDTQKIKNILKSSTTFKIKKKFTFNNEFKKISQNFLNILNELTTSKFNTRKTTFKNFSINYKNWLELNLNTFKDNFKNKKNKITSIYTPTYSIFKKNTSMFFNFKTLENVSKDYSFTKNNKNQFFFNKLSRLNAEKQFNKVINVNSFTYNYIERALRYNYFSKIRSLKINFFKKDFSLNFADTNNNVFMDKNLENIYLVVKQKRLVPINKGKLLSKPTTNLINNSHLSLFQDLNTKIKYIDYFKVAKNKPQNFSNMYYRRLLRTKRILVLPTNVNVTLITNSFDVVHSWYIPGLGIKLDCVPGRSTHHTINIDHAGFYYGQCAEICGRYHHHMPIRVCALPFEHFLVWWYHFGIPYFNSVKTTRKKSIKSGIRQYNW